MLRHGKAARSGILAVVLVLQAACLRPMGPPVPPRPEDPTWICTIQSADRVKVWTIDHQQYKLDNASVAEQSLTGEWLGEEVVPIPVDSVAGIQLFNRRGVGLYMMGVLTGVAGVVGFMAALAASL